MEIKQGAWPLQFFGRRKGKKLHSLRQDAHDTVLPKITLKLPEGAAPFAPAACFDFKPQDIWLEIGFGNGENLAQQALLNPKVGMIGCEPFINGVAALCVSIKQNDIKNIRVWPDDARLLLSRLPDASIGRLFLLNADPWPKKRHHKRRFIQTEMLNEFHRLLKPGAELVMSTDDPGLAAWELEKTYFHKGFEWTAENCHGWQNRPAGMEGTRYQKKGAAQGRPTIFLNFRKI